MLEKNLCLLKSEYDQEMSQSQTEDQPGYRVEETQNILGLDCILFKSKFPLSFFKDCKYYIPEQM